MQSSPLVCYDTRIVAAEVSVPAKVAWRTFVAELELTMVYTLCYMQ